LNLSDLPDIQFAEKDPETILNEMITGYENAYFVQTGVQKTLYPGDPIRIWLYTQALRELQLRQIIDFSAKQNLLKYATGDYLENIGAPWVTRDEAKISFVSVKFILSEAQSVIQIIPQGTRVSPSNTIYFETTKDIEVAVGATDVIIVMNCTESGTIGNDFIPGQINILSDPLPWIQSVINIDKSQGGIDSEDDESLRERIWLAPESFTTAGPEGAYEFFAKKYSSLITDVKVISPTAGNVNVIVLLENGEIPSVTFLQGLNDYLDTKTIRPLTDHVTANAPDVISYDIAFTYYILTTNTIVEASIKTKVDQAVQDYILWQKSKISRDINSSELTARIIAAGAKRVSIIAPIYTSILNVEVAISSSNVVATYGGLEDD